MVDNEDWNKPYKEIQNFDDYLNIIINWDNRFDTWEAYYIDGILGIFVCCLDYIESIFDDNKIKITVDQLRPKELDLLLKIVKGLENYMPEKDSSSIEIIETDESVYVPIDPKNPFNSIESYMDFTGLIENWGTIMKDDEEFKLNGMIQIFKACLQHMIRIFDDEDIEELGDSLRDYHIDFLFKIGVITKKKASCPNED